MKSQDKTIPTPEWAIGPNAPPGVLIKKDGEIRFTPYGLGYMMVEVARQKGMPLPEAIVYVSECVANCYRRYLEQGQPGPSATANADRILASAKMRLEEVYRGGQHPVGSS